MIYLSHIVIIWEKILLISGHWLITVYCCIHFKGWSFRRILFQMQ